MQGKRYNTNESAKEQRRVNLEALGKYFDMRFAYSPFPAQNGASQGAGTSKRPRPEAFMPLSSMTSFKASCGGIGLSFIG